MYSFIKIYKIRTKKTKKSKKNQKKICGLKKKVVPLWRECELWI